MAPLTMAVEVEISELLLDGFEPAAGRRFAAAMTRELERLFADPRTPGAWSAGGQWGVLRASTVSPAGAAPEPVAVARAVFGALPR